MDSLFTPEVIEQFLKLLETAADGGLKAFILWLLLPTVAILISASAWVYGIAYVIKKLVFAYESRLQSVVRLKELEKSTAQMLDFKGVLVNAEAETELRDLLRDVRNGSYVHRSDIEKIRTMLCKHTNSVSNMFATNDDLAKLRDLLRKVNDNRRHFSSIDLRKLEEAWDERVKATK